MTVRVETAPFDPGAETNRFLAETAGAGAAVTFTGLVRSNADDPVATLTLECYPELALNQIGEHRRAKPLNDSRFSAPTSSTATARSGPASPSSR